MASLQQLLAEEGFERGKFTKTRNPVKKDDSITLPIYICHDRKSSIFLKQKTDKRSSVFSSKRVGSVSERSNNSKSLVSVGSSSRRDEPAIDDVAIRAVVSILSGYIGRYVKDVNFRETLRDKCNSCLVRRKKETDNGIFANIELGIESIDKLVEDHQGARKELRMKTLRNSIRLLNIVGSLNSKKSRNGSTCGTPNSHISACAQLYLAIVYKLEKNDQISARHLLQVFCDSPFLARTHLLPDLWEHFFLPHLLHLKIWYTKELEILSNTEYAEKENKMKALSKVYDEQMDKGTIQFAMYYKGWLKVGAKAPPVPTVPLPSRPSHGSTRRRSSDSYSSRSSINKNLYRTVFGPTYERHSVDLDDRNRALVNTWGLEEEEKLYTDEDNYICSFVHKGHGTHQRSSSQNYRNSQSELLPETQKSDYFRFFSCRSTRKECLVNRHHTTNNCSVGNEGSTYSSELSRAIATVCSSDILSDCEIAIRIITKAWLDSHGDPAIEAELSEATIIEGMLEVLFASDDDEILELVISILAEFVGRNEVIRQIILTSDPQLEIFMRLLRSSSLFLKAAILLYLSKPKAKQMISVEWVPLVLEY